MAGELDGGPTPRAAPCGDAQAPALRYQLAAATPADIRTLRDELVAWSRRAGLGAPAVEALALACYEAMANVVEHAYSRAGTIDVEAEHRVAEQLIEITIVDRGNWVPPDSDGHPNRGQGIPLIHNLADRAVITPTASGTTVELSWQIGPRS
ncbi:ATP-binding protein [Saccharopolyspora sp. NPDC000359]|uniref:ATP-binding protein n=1 Tax=Saccharopolyspora sp. NPDC000359 TaxID=3154251 RepID=UPI00331D02AB